MESETSSNEGCVIFWPVCTEITWKWSIGERQGVSDRLKCGIVHIYNILKSGFVHDSNTIFT